MASRAVFVRRFFLADSRLHCHPKGRPIQAIFYCIFNDVIPANRGCAASRRTGRFSARHFCSHLTRKRVPLAAHIMPVEFLISALVTLLVVVDPIGLVPTFIAITARPAGAARAATWRCAPA